MKIAFDAKRFFHNTSGLGNYSRDLVRILAKYSPEDEFVLLAEKQSQRGKEILSLPNVSYASVSKGMLARQLKMGVDAQNLGANIFHGLSGELPLKWNEKPIKKIVTIHDLIFVRYPELYSFLTGKSIFGSLKSGRDGRFSHCNIRADQKGHYGISENSRRKKSGWFIQGLVIRLFKEKIFQRSS